MKSNDRKSTIPPEFWGTYYEARYQNLSQAARRKRAGRHRALSVTQEEEARARLDAALARLTARHRVEVLVHKPDAPWWGYVELMRHVDADAALIYRKDCEPLWREQRASQATKRAAAAAARAQDGFACESVAVGGNAAYPTSSMRYNGLISDESPILKFFVSKLPRGRNLKSGDKKDQAESAPLGSKLLGCDHAYVEGLKTLRGFIRVELDRALTWSAIQEACHSAGVPLPNIAVGWIDANGVVQNPHLVWLLHDSVAFTERGKHRFKCLFNAVLKGMTGALLPYGADPGGICNCMRLKNPLSPLWQRHIFAEVPYTLDHLVRHINTSAALPPTVVTMPMADHPDREVAVGSNAFFRQLTSWARQAVISVRDEADGDEAEWQSHVEVEAINLVRRLGGCGRSDNDAGDARGERAALRLAQRVAQWTWKNVRPVNQHAVRLTADEVAKWQAQAGRLTAAMRADRCRAEIIGAARIVASEQGNFTQAAVSALLRATTGISKRSVERHWPAVRAALTRP